MENDCNGDGNHESDDDDDVVELVSTQPSHDYNESDDCDDVVEPVLSCPSSLNQGEGQHIHQNYRNKLKQK